MQGCTYMKELFSSFQGTEMAKSDSWGLKSGLVPYEGHLWKGILAWTGRDCLWSFLARELGT